MTNGDAVIVTGVGQHQMWAAQTSPTNTRALSSPQAAPAAMGYEVPGAMGVQVGGARKAVWSVAGDGGFR